MTQQRSRWPNGAKAAISFTMDNLGEAQDVNKGVWPADKPVGQHSSVLQTLPRMLDMLGEHGVKATYFAESWSLDVYTDAVNDMADRGHEIAWHGFQHEVWSGLSSEDEERNFRDSFTQAARHGVQYHGFRPPGGAINRGTTNALLRKWGVRYTSPLGTLGIDEDGIVVLPFEWKGVDAFWYMTKFAPIRKAHGESEATLGTAEFQAFLRAKIVETVESGGYLSVLFHPFLQTSDERLAVMGAVLQRIAHDTDIWCAPCNDVAQWVVAHPDDFRGGGASS